MLESLRLFESPERPERRQARHVRQPVVVEWRGQTQLSYTTIQRVDGAVLTSDVHIEPGERVALSDFSSGARALASVLRAWREAPEGSGGSPYRLAVRLQPEAVGSFWRPAGEGSQA